MTEASTASPTNANETKDDNKAENSHDNIATAAAATKPTDSYVYDMLQTRIAELQVEAGTQAVVDEEIEKQTVSMMDSLSSDTESSLLQKYQDLLKKYLRGEHKMKQMQSSTIKVQDENSRLQSELDSNKQRAARLEDLCRELHRETKRLSISNEMAQQQEKLMADAMEITTRVESQLKKVSAENEDLREKLGSVLKDTHTRELLYEKQMHTRDLELQLSEKKLEQSDGLRKLAEEKASKFEEQLELDIKLVETLNRQIEESEKELNTLRATLTQSQEYFTTLNKEVDKMRSSLKEQTEKNLALHVAVQQLQGRAEKAEKDRNLALEAATAYEKKIDMLEQLCRQLQQLTRLEAMGQSKVDEEEEEKQSGEGGQEEEESVDEENK